MYYRAKLTEINNDPKKDVREDSHLWQKDLGHKNYVGHNMPFDRLSKSVVVDHN